MMISLPATKCIKDIVNLRPTKPVFFADTHSDYRDMTIFTDQPSGEATYGFPRNTFLTPKTPNGHGRKA